jgi:raffinose synthase
MFQSSHAMGGFHAAARAISGSSVYVSDKPDGHDFEVLRKLVCRDGSILRCTDVGRPSPDCLFHDPTREAVLLKIFNFNAHGAVLGVFHAKYDEGKAPVLSSTISPSDVPGLAKGESYAVLAHRSGELGVMKSDEKRAVQLNRGEWEIFTLAPVRDGHAVLGLSDKYNSGGAIQDLRHEGNRSIFRIRDGGVLVLYARKASPRVLAGGSAVSCDDDRSTGKVTVRIPSAGEVIVEWS